VAGLPALPVDESTAKLLFDAAPFGVALFDAEVRFRYVNPHLAAINGCSVAAHIGQHPSELLGPVSAGWVAVVEEVVRTGVARPAFRFSGDEAVAGDRAGSTFEVSYQPVHDPSGAVAGVVATVRDITHVAVAERRRAAVSAATSALAGARTQADVARIIAEHLDGTVVRRTALRFPRDEPVDTAGWTPLPVHATRGGEIAELHVEPFPAGADGEPDGDALDVARTIAAVAGGALTRIAMTEAVEENRFQRALEAMLDDVAIGVPVRDADGLIIDFELVHANTRNKDGAGRPIQSLLGRRMLTLFPSWKASGLFDAFVDVVETGQPFVVDELHYADEVEGGGTIEGWWRMQTVRFDDGYLAISRDVTADVRARRELEEARIRLGTERAAVRVLQEIALPTVLPSAPGLRMAAHYRSSDSSVPVGGDWYDAFELPDGRIGLAIGDVAGHGRHAAATMVRLRTVMAAYAATGEAPSQVVEWTHHSAARDDGVMATCAYAVIDPQERTLTIARAGHVPMVVMDGTGVHVLEVAGGLPIGAGTGATYEDTVVPLVGRATIVLYTDGLVERRGVVVDHGIERLRSVLERHAGAPPQVLADAVVDAVAGQPIDDDFCVLVCEIDQ
jgi:PAS domain S-box-containing protein